MRGSPLAVPVRGCWFFREAAARHAGGPGRAQEAQSLQELIDEYNVNVPAYKRIYSLKVRESEFEKTASRKIKRS